MLVVAVVLFHEQFEIEFCCVASLDTQQTCATNNELHHTNFRNIPKGVGIHIPYTTHRECPMPILIMWILFVICVVHIFAIDPDNNNDRHSLDNTQIAIYNLCCAVGPQPGLCSICWHSLQAIVPTLSLWLWLIRVNSRASSKSITCVLNAIRYVSALCVLCSLSLFRVVSLLMIVCPSFNINTHHFSFWHLVYIIMEDG